LQQQKSVVKRDLSKPLEKAESTQVVAGKKPGSLPGEPRVNTNVPLNVKKPLSLSAHKRNSRDTGKNAASNKPHALCKDKDYSWSNALKSEKLSPKKKKKMGNLLEKDGEG